MSAPEKGETLKGGHPPAVKVGGMRVGQHHIHHSELKASERAKEEEEFQTEKPEEKPLVVSGVVAEVNRDYPPEAVKAAHEKPHPTHEKPSKVPKAGAGRGPDIRVGQPRKFNN